MEYIQLYVNVDDDVTTVDYFEETHNQNGHNFIDDDDVSVDRNFSRQFANFDRDLNEPINDWQDWLDTRGT